MTDSEYKKQRKITRELLDKLPIKDFLIPDKEVNSIMDAIQDAYDDHEFSEEIDSLVEKELHGYIFNVMGEYEFMNYCRDKFQTQWNEETRYYLWS